MEVWYRLHGNRLREVEVERFTDNSVWITEQFWSDRKPQVVRKQRHGSFEHFFATKQEGIEFIEKRLMGAVESAKKKLDRAKSDLGEYRNRLKKGQLVLPALRPVSGELILD